MAIVTTLSIIPLNNRESVITVVKNWYFAVMIKKKLYGKGFRYQLDELKKITDYFQEEEILEVISGGSIEEIYAEIKKAIEGES